MRKFMVVGNCQAEAIAKVLMRNPLFDYSYIKYEPIYILEESKLDDFYDDLRKVDLIITQPIGKSYRGNYKFSTESILSAISESCKVIMIPSLYFDWYYPSYANIKNLDKPISYQDKNLLRIYCQDGNIEEYVKMVLDENLFSQEFLDKLLEKNINELRTRECKYADYIPDITNDVHFINSSDFISENYKNKLLFYSFNHPTKYLLRYIAESIFDVLDIQKMDYLDNFDPLRNSTCIVYASILKNVNFAVGDIIIDNKIITVEEMAQLYVDYYKTFDREFLRRLEKKLIF